MPSAPNTYVWDWGRQVLAEWPLARIDALPVGWMHGDDPGRNIVFVQDAGAAFPTMVAFSWLLQPRF